jgi:hypothetical protein
MPFSVTSLVIERKRTPQLAGGGELRTTLRQLRHFQPRNTLMGIQRPGDGAGGEKRQAVRAAESVG